MHDSVASGLKSVELSSATTAARAVVPVDVSVQIVAQAGDVSHVQSTIGSKEFFRHCRCINVRLFHTTLILVS